MFILPVYLCIIILPTLRVVITIQRNSQLQCNCHTDPTQLSAQKLGLKEVVGNWPRSWKMANGTMAKPGCKILCTKSTTFWASGRGSGAVNSNRMTTSATTTTPNNIHCNAMFESLWPLTKPESVSCQFHTHKKLNNLALWQYNHIHITLQLHEHYTHTLQFHKLLQWYNLICMCLDDVPFSNLQEKCSESAEIDKHRTKLIHFRRQHLSYVTF